MSWFELIADRKIRDALEEGAFDNLPGKGKPLDLESDARVPAELRAAYRIMKEAKVLPDWIQLAKEIRTREEQWTARVEAFARRRGEELAEAAGLRGRELLEEERRLDRSRDHLLCATAAELREQNRMIDRLNLIVPSPTQQRVRLNAAERLSDLEQRFPRFHPRPSGDEAPWHAMVREDRPPTRLSNRMPLRARRGSIG